MLNLLLSNKLAALFSLLATIGSQRQASLALRGGHAVIRGVALAAWAVVAAGFFPGFQVVCRLPDSSLTIIDSRFPIGWLILGVCLTVLIDRCWCLTSPIAHDSNLAPTLADPRFWLGALIAAGIADRQFPLFTFLLGGIHSFQPWEGILGLIFLLYPAAAFSGRMGSVGATLGFGLFALGFGAFPAAMLFLASSGISDGIRLGPILGAAAMACVLLTGLEGLGGQARFWSPISATVLFIVLHQFGSRRSTEVRAS